MNSLSIAAMACLLLGLAILLTSEAASISAGDAAIDKRYGNNVPSDLTAEERLFVSAAWNKAKELVKGAAPALLEAGKAAAIAGGKALAGKLGK